MTREEAIFCEKSYVGETNCVDCKYYGTETCQSRESHRMAIKALVQEPTTKNDLGVDAVSRQAVIGTIYDNKSDFKNDFAQGFFADKIRELPSVTPQEPKTGHWILGGYDDNYYICDKCNYKASEYYFKPRYNFCPNCGARMIEPQESEDKE